MPTEPEPDARTTVHDWVVANRLPTEVPAPDSEPWTLRAIRGTAARSFPIAFLFAMLGIFSSMQQALLNFGAGVALVAASTLVERWLTRRGPVRWPKATAHGIGVACATSLTRSLLILMEETEYAELAWQDPTLALTTLLEPEALSLFATAALVGLFQFFPLGLCAGAYVNARSATDAFAQAFVTGMWLCVASLAVGLFTNLVYALGGGELGGGLAVGVVVFLMAFWVYTVPMVLLFLYIFAILDGLERLVFPGKPTRWDPDLPH